MTGVVAADRLRAQATAEARRRRRPARDFSLLHIGIVIDGGGARRRLDAISGDVAVPSLGGMPMVGVRYDGVCHAASSLSRHIIERRLFA